MMTLKKVIHGFAIGKMNSEFPRIPTVLLDPHESRTKMFK